jgi:cell division septum initiation protein DivIVA
VENEKFQDLVLNHLAKLTQDNTELKQELSSFKQEVNERFDKVESKIDAIQAQTAKTTEDLSALSTKMDQGFTDVVEVQKALLDMYGEHEAEIRIMRKKTV